MNRSDLPGADLPVEGLLDRVRAVAPLVAERASDAEQRRRPDDDVIDALKATGVFRAFVPKRFGGYEIDLDLFGSAKAYERLARQDPQLQFAMNYFGEAAQLLNIGKNSTATRAARLN